MKHVSAARGIVPLGEFKAGAARILRDLASERGPLIITQNGRPAGVLLSPLEYDRLRERHEFLESVAAGVADAEAGRTMDSDELVARLADIRGRRRRP